MRAFLDTSLSLHEELCGLRQEMKVMFKTKEQSSEVKVVGRYLYIGELKYDVTNIPEDFKETKERT